MKNILVPTDFSKLSIHALDFAVQLAKPLKASIQVIHLEEIPHGDLSLQLSGGAGGSPISEDILYDVQLLKANKKRLAELEETYADSEVSVTAFQHGGGFLEGIQTYLEKESADLIVIGTTGEESIQEFFSGNHTEQLIEHVNIPVVSVQAQQFHPIEDIVLGLDLDDEKYTQSSFTKIKPICEALGSTLHIIDVTKSKDDEKMMARLNRVAKIVGLKNYLVDVIEDSKPQKALLEYADGTGAGLIIVLSEAKGGLQRFLQHSFATKLTKKSAIPVMTFNKSI